MKLIVEGISKSYGKHRVLDDISFEVENGGIVGLLGRNGAGKTTLLRMMAGLSRPDSGSLRWANGEGRSLDQMKGKSQAQVSL